MNKFYAEQHDNSECSNTTTSAVTEPFRNVLPNTSRLNKYRVARTVRNLSFTCTPMHLSTNGTNHGFAFPVEAGPHFTDVREIQGLVKLVG